MNAPPLSSSILQALAPQLLVSHRTQRYAGDNQNVALDEFPPAVRAVVERLYATLIDLFEVLKTQRDQPGGLAAVQSWLAQQGWDGMIEAVQQVSLQEVAPAPSQRLREVLHDVKGGSFFALSISLQLLALGIAQGDDLTRLFFLTRDHLKMMRNGIRDIDPLRTERDRQQQDHHMRLIVEKWTNMVYRLGSSTSAAVQVDCTFDGNIAERCLEFSSLDRVMYNLMNNAVRHTADGQVYLSIFPVGGAEPHDVRFVIYNRIAPEQAARLRERFGSNLSRMFTEGFSTTGSGLGMHICAEFVANAYGVPSLERCLSERYLGATAVDLFFVNWFHWPIAAD